MIASLILKSRMLLIIAVALFLIIDICRYLAVRLVSQNKILNITTFTIAACLNITFPIAFIVIATLIKQDWLFLMFAYFVVFYLIRTISMIAKGKYHWIPKSLCFSQKQAEEYITSWNNTS
ncbi:MAG: hypothetical protein KAJ14_12770 [Candidatus Omnitrophica bacterium]|nr:hypothetical protein [Candidatus Omnitrophota bacterium]MCK5591703.1 hypothetical protein [Candidatus Paceibacterota bacterium]